MLKGGFMIGKNVKGVRAVTLSEVLDILEKRKRMGPLGYEQQSTYDYSLKFNKFDSKSVKNLMDKFVNEFGLSDRLAVNIIDSAPEYKSTLKTILAQDKIDLGEDKLNEILKLIEDNLNESNEKKQKKKEKKIKEKKEGKERKTGEKEKEGKSKREGKKEKGKS